MEMQEGHGSGNYVICTGEIQRTVGEFMQYSADQVMLLDHFFVECQKPSHLMRVAMIRENPALASLNSRQIQAWFEHRRFLEEKKMDPFVLNLLNEKVAAIGRVLLLENDFLHGEVQRSLKEKAYIRKLLQYASLESFLALEVPRSVFKNVKIVGTRRVLLLHNEYLHNEVQRLHREKEYVQNLLENVLSLSIDYRKLMIARLCQASNTEFMVDSYCSWSRAADTSKGLRFLSGTRAKFLPITPSKLNRVSVPRIERFGGLKDISVNSCSDLTNFSINGIIFDVSVLLSFVKAAMITDGPLDFLRKPQEFILCCSVKDIKPVLQRSQESLSAVIPAFLPQGFRVVVGRYCVSGAWIYFPNEQAAHGNVKLIVRFNFVN